MASGSVSVLDLISVLCFMFYFCCLFASPVHGADGAVRVFAGRRGSDGATGRDPGQTGDGSLHGPAARKQTLI